MKSNRVKRKVLRSATCASPDGSLVFASGTMDASLYVVNVSSGAVTTLHAGLPLVTPTALSLTMAGGVILADQVKSRAWIVHLPSGYFAAVMCRRQ